MFGKKETPSESILILGLGGIGFYLAKRLVHEGYAVTVIESNSELARFADIGNKGIVFFSDGPTAPKPGPIFISAAITLLIAVT